MSSKVRLLQGQTVLEDDRKLCEYSLPEGATISALFEPDVNISIDVSIGLEVQCLMSHLSWRSRFTSVTS